VACHQPAEIPQEILVVGLEGITVSGVGEAKEKAHDRGGANEKAT
jgi:hypothetical protein